MKINSRTQCLVVWASVCSLAWSCQTCSKEVALEIPTLQQLHLQKILRSTLNHWFQIRMGQEGHKGPQKPSETRIWSTTLQNNTSHIKSHVSTNTISFTHSQESMCLNSKQLRQTRSRLLPVRHRCNSLSPMVSCHHTCSSNRCKRSTTKHHHMLLRNSSSNSSRCL